MPYCLGLHIEDNLIKYAKVQIDRDSMPKVGSHGIVFYDNINMAIEQIIKETYSHNADIATNLDNEIYDYTEVFSGIKKSSLTKHLKLYFAEEVCVNRKLNPSSFQSRYILGKKKYDDDNVEAIYISANKSDISNKTQIFKRKMKKLLPVSLANLSLLDMDENTNVVILNIDSTSTATVILQGKVKKVININVGMSNILSGLNKKYGSYSKSYKECKSITLYNENAKDLIDDIDTEDLNRITPLLYDLGQRLTSILAEYEGIVNKVYVTGLGIAINNIDLYFEEMLNDIKVEILKPSFLANNFEISNKIKEYTEVNSAIALAISNGKIGDDDFNFVSSNTISDITNKIMGNDVINKLTEKLPKGKKKEESLIDVKDKKVNITLPSNMLFTEVMASLLVLLAYFGVTTYVSKTYAKNTKSIQDEMNNINLVIKTVESDARTIASNRQKYDDLDKKIQELVDQMSEVNGITYDVPNLLTSIAFVTPDEVIINKINISPDKKVTIEAKCATYSPLGFFISEIKNNDILMNVKTELVEQFDNEEENSDSKDTKKDNTKTNDTTNKTSEFNGQKIIITGEIL